jgi:hypothetical protein
VSPEHQAALQVVASIRARIEDVRQVVHEQLQPSRSVSIALTELDTCELWLARAAGEQSGAQDVQVPA